MYHTEYSLDKGWASMNFTYYLPANIVFGFGKANQVGELVKPYGKKAVIVTGKSSARKSLFYDRVRPH